jgi:cytochrome c1
MRFTLIYVILSFGAAGCGHRRSQPDAVLRGRAAIAARGCGACHIIEGVFGATGLAAPPLDGIGARQVIAGRLSNTRENLARWILDPAAVEPGVAMPPLVNPGSTTVSDIAAYLETLK